jgi:hypothetical protein
LKQIREIEKTGKGDVLTSRSIGAFRTGIRCLLPYYCQKCKASEKGGRGNIFP